MKQEDRKKHGLSIRHVVTKRIEKNTVKLIFEVENASKYTRKGELLLELRWFWGSIWNGSLGHYEVSPGHKKRFAVSIPVWTGILWRRFIWGFEGGFQQPSFLGEGKKNTLYEDLRRI